MIKKIWGFTYPGVKKDYFKWSWLTKWKNWQIIIVKSNVINQKFRIMNKFWNIIGTQAWWSCRNSLKNTWTFKSKLIFFNDMLQWMEDNHYLTLYVYGPTPDHLPSKTIFEIKLILIGFVISMKLFRFW